MSSFGLKAQTHCVDSVEINFKVSKWDLDRGVGDNAAHLDSIEHRFTTVYGDSIYRLRHVSIVGGASPEGSVPFNEMLSRRRAATLFDYLSKYRRLADADKDYTFLGRNWAGVLALARLDGAVPYRDETLTLLEAIADEKARTGREPAGSLERIKALRGGEPYRYLLVNIFPKVRASKVVMVYDKVLRPEMPKPVLPALQLDSIDFAIYTVAHDTVPIVVEQPRKPFYMDIRTNMLYDLAAVPNIGVDFYLGKNYTIGANWMYGWWRNDNRHSYWRIYGGEINARKFFGTKADEKPLTGHHLGLYAGALTFDFEWGGKGYMGGRPGGSLWDRCMIYGGVEYGYSLHVSTRLNIDFTIGVGYMGGKLVKYHPMDGCYVWDSTSNYKWFGPTKVEVSLVWLIGRGNTNPRKGGGSR